MDQSIDIENIRKEIFRGNSEILREHYLNYRGDFIRFSSKYGVSEEQTLDFYQESFLILHENILEGRLKELSSSLKTYVFSIGKHLIYKYFKSNSRMVNIELNDEIKKLAVEDEEVKSTERYDLIKKIISELGAQCREILQLYYLRGWTIKEITDALVYKNVNVTKSHKSRCMKKIRDLV